ncbi:protein kinase [Oscillochloris sp. ZM17-4]|uniref:serine/threonine-protein kinase n=1 Tax=Oscillochloris sp. ZM17-4 TaxID=2866714 RepID=UPI001C72F8CE|nr:serine/threonine-protein kinase [Oscillochloris sp. ZM17-4]MBX0329612.1 protein kinase [Oscillochloris sp. ZM17-4]
MNIPEQIGNYTLDREIGSGASSQVWLAHHTKLPERQVAVKVLMSQEREAIRRFQREAAIAARLRHPNIVQLYDHGYSQPFFYTMLEHIEGGSLRQLIERQGRIQLDAALRIFRQIAAALDYAHSLGVVHRDMSPGNILIEQGSERALLTDFGIARENGQAITVVNAIMGTPGFFSPEHVQGARAVTHSSDIFSLGVIFYHMLSAQLPWDEPPGLPDNPGFDPPIPLRQRGVESMPADVDRVMLTMLALDPTRRFPSARAAVDELDRIFARHQMTTQIILGATPAAAPTPTGFQSVGVAANEIETTLGPDLIRAPIDRAHRRAEDMRSAPQLASLLDVWAGQHRMYIALLGRLARLHKASSANVYFYRLRLLYEQRSPAEDDEEPDIHAQPFALTPEVDRWKIELPVVTDFSEHPGDRVILPGSTRVVACRPCEGRGLTPCPHCHGKQRVLVTRQIAVSPTGAGAATAAATFPNGAGGGRRTRGSATQEAEPPATAQAPPAPRTEQVLVPCPECEGRGGITCARCEGVGRLVQRKTFRWRRRTDLIHAQDDRPALDESWLQRTCKAELIYRERQSGGFRPEWSTLKAIAPMLAEAQQRADPDTRIVLSELTITFIPVTDIVFDLGKPGDSGLYKLTIYGFENMIPADWRFFNWERVIMISITAFSLLIALICAYFAFR